MAFRSLAPTAPARMIRHGYSDRDTVLRPVPLGLALGVTAGLFAGYLLAPQEVIDRILPADPINTEHIPLDPPPPVAQPRIDVSLMPPPTPHVNTPRPPIVSSLDPPILGNPEIKGPVVFSSDPDIGANNHAIPMPPMTTPLPVLTAPVIDPRFASAFQPDYPGAMLRAEEEGIARISVLIGADGRVREVRDLGSSNATFFNATARHAKLRWRFKPATRDRTPVEQWHSMTVRFTLND